MCGLHSTPASKRNAGEQLAEPRQQSAYKQITDNT